MVVPLRPEADWGIVKPFCRAFAETMAADEPTLFLAHLKIADRQWSYPGRLAAKRTWRYGSVVLLSRGPVQGAGVATPLAWSEVKPGLDPAAFTVLTVPKRLAGQKRDPWLDFDRVDQALPDLIAEEAAA